MPRSNALPDDRPRVHWAGVVRDVPRALALLGAALVALLVSGLMLP